MPALWPPGLPLACAGLLACSPGATGAPPLPAPSTPAPGSLDRHRRRSPRPGAGRQCQLFGRAGPDHRLLALAPAGRLRRRAAAGGLPGGSAAGQPNLHADLRRPGDRAGARSHRRPRDRSPLLRTDGCEISDWSTRACCWRPRRCRRPARRLENGCRAPADDRGRALIREKFAATPQREAPFSTVGGQPIEPLYTADDLPARPRRRPRATRASTRSPAASTPRCTAGACGPCASSPASAPPGRPTSASVPARPGPDRPLHRLRPAHA